MTLIKKRVPLGLLLRLRRFPRLAGRGERMPDREMMRMQPWRRRRARRVGDRNEQE